MTFSQDKKPFSKVSKQPQLFGYPMDRSSDHFMQAYQSRTPHERNLLRKLRLPKTEYAFEPSIYLGSRSLGPRLVTVPKGASREPIMWPAQPDPQVYSPH